MLAIHDLHAYYGKSHVLHGVNFDVQPGEIVALLEAARRRFARAWGAAQEEIETETQALGRTP